MKAIKLFCLMAAAILAACTSQNEKIASEQKANGFMDLARARFAVREYAQTPVE